VTIGTPMVLSVFDDWYSVSFVKKHSKQSKDSQTAKNDYWCTNRHMSTRSPPNTQSRANAATLQNLHHMCLATLTARRPWAGLTVCVYMDVHASGSRSLPRAATLSSTY